MGQTTAHTMRADAKAMTGATADVTPLLGRWVNAKRDTDHVTTVVVTQRDGGLSVRMHGSSAGEPVDWGETEAVPYAFTGTTDVAGFHARYVFGDASVEIAANVKLGILVIQTYTSFSDGRLSQFSREFFHRSSASFDGDVVRTGLAFLVGDWVNTHTATMWIRGFTIADRGEDFTVRVRGASDPTDWGETTIVPYLDGAGEPAFRADYDLGAVQAALAGNVGKNIIIIAGYFRIQGGGAANTFCREFFVPR